MQIEDKRTKQTFSIKIEFRSRLVKRLLPKMQKFVHAIGMHIFDGEQHELTTQIKSIDEQVNVVSLHISKIEHKIPGAQKDILSNVR